MADEQQRICTEYNRQKREHIWKRETETTHNKTRKSVQDTLAERRRAARWMWEISTEYAGRVGQALQKKAQEGMVTESDWWTICALWEYKEPTHIQERPQERKYTGYETGQVIVIQVKVEQMGEEDQWVWCPAWIREVIPYTDQEQQYEMLQVLYYKSPEDDNIDQSGSVKNASQCSQRRRETVDTKEEVTQPYMAYKEKK